MRWRDSVVPALSAGLMTSNPSTSAQLAKRLDARSMRSLGTCSDLLHQHRAEPPIDETRVAAIRKAITELEDSADSDPHAGPEFRQFLRNHARAMTQAVDDLPIRGSAALAGALTWLSVLLCMKNVASGKRHTPQRLEEIPRDDHCGRRRAADTAECGADARPTPLT
jgi:hypothetical protein